MEDLPGTPAGEDAGALSRPSPRPAHGREDPQADKEASECAPPPFQRSSLLAQTDPSRPRIPPLLAASLNSDRTRPSTSATARDRTGKFRWGGMVSSPGGDMAGQASPGGEASGQLLWEMTMELAELSAARVMDIVAFHFLAYHIVKETESRAVINLSPKGSSGALAPPEGEGPPTARSGASDFYTPPESPKKALMAMCQEYRNEEDPRSLLRHMRHCPYIASYWQALRQRVEEDHPVGQAIRLALAGPEVLRVSSAWENSDLFITVLDTLERPYRLVSDGDTAEGPPTAVASSSGHLGDTLTSAPRDQGPSLTMAGDSLGKSKEDSHYGGPSLPFDGTQRSSLQKSRLGGSAKLEDQSCPETGSLHFSQDKSLAPHEDLLGLGDGRGESRQSHDLPPQQSPLSNTSLPPPGRSREETDLLGQSERESLRQSGPSTARRSAGQSQEDTLHYSERAAYDDILIDRSLIDDVQIEEVLVEEESPRDEGQEGPPGGILVVDLAHQDTLEAQNKSFEMSLSQGRQSGLVSIGGSQEASLRLSRQTPTRRSQEGSLGRSRDDDGTEVRGSLHESLASEGGNGKERLGDSRTSAHSHGGRSREEPGPAPVDLLGQSQQSSGHRRSLGQSQQDVLHESERTASVRSKQSSPLGASHEDPIASPDAQDDSAQSGREDLGGEEQEAEDEPLVDTEDTALLPDAGQEVEISHEEEEKQQTGLPLRKDEEAGGHGAFQQDPMNEEEENNELGGDDIHGEDENADDEGEAVPQQVIHDAYKEEEPEPPRATPSFMDFMTNEPPPPLQPLPPFRPSYESQQSSDEEFTTGGFIDAHDRAKMMKGIKNQVRQQLFDLLDTDAAPSFPLAQSAAPTPFHLAGDRRNVSTAARPVKSMSSPGAMTFLPASGGTEGDALRVPKPPRRTCTYPSKAALADEELRGQAIAGKTGGKLSLSGEVIDLNQSGAARTLEQSLATPENEATPFWRASVLGRTHAGLDDLPIHLTLTTNVGKSLDEHLAPQRKSLPSVTQITANTGRSKAKSLPRILVKTVPFGVGGRPAGVSAEDRRRSSEGTHDDDTSDDEGFITGPKLDEIEERERERLVAGSGQRVSISKAVPFHAALSVTSAPRSSVEEPEPQTMAQSDKQPGDTQPTAQPIHLTKGVERPDTEPEEEQTAPQPRQEIPRVSELMAYRSPLLQSMPSPAPPAPSRIATQTDMRLSQMARQALRNQPVPPLPSPTHPLRRGHEASVLHMYKPHATSGGHEANGPRSTQMSVAAKKAASAGPMVLSAALAVKPEALPRGQTVAVGAHGRPPIPHPPLNRHPFVPYSRSPGFPGKYASHRLTKPPPAMAPPQQDTSSVHIFLSPPASSRPNAIEIGPLVPPPSPVSPPMDRWALPIAYSPSGRPLPGALLPLATVPTSSFARDRSVSQLHGNVSLKEREMVTSDAMVSPRQGSSWFGCNKGDRQGPCAHCSPVRAPPTIPGPAFVRSKSTPALIPLLPIHQGASLSHRSPSSPALHRQPLMRSGIPLPPLLPPYMRHPSSLPHSPMLQVQRPFFPFHGLPMSPASLASPGPYERAALGSFLSPTLQPPALFSASQSLLLPKARQPSNGVVSALSIYGNGQKSPASPERVETRTSHMLSKPPIPRLSVPPLPLPAVRNLSASPMGVGTIKEETTEEPDTSRKEQEKGCGPFVSRLFRGNRGDRDKHKEGLPSNPFKCQWRCSNEDGNEAATAAAATGGPGKKAPNVSFLSPAPGAAPRVVPFQPDPIPPSNPEASNTLPSHLSSPVSRLTGPNPLPTTPKMIQPRRMSIEGQRK
ncbi:unnamed protein product [Vitrella brassicaformis CCMP3155]|uniref:Uncharacterized protein n=7 Tax=Vitrella brassicaformis TaxID=1169539 RepID=A0A0G4GUS8_VITBC|nr:unnamed protein product [Vitrella brassicaformis CCMP3155]|eukprot:CEM34598.1 unnamed protein product [Vitrella brassicaformis CCMP3155]